MRKIFFLTTFFVLVLLISINVNAWYIPNKTSFAVGATFVDIDTTSQSNNAHTAYSSMGLDYSKKINNPTKSSVLGSHGNGTKYLNSGIVFLAGHGEESGLGIVLSQNGNNKFYIRSGETGNNIININNYIDSSNGLIFLCGCKTAYGNDNLSKRVVDQGAKISVGFAQTVRTGAITSWSKRFNNKIKDKTTTVNSARSYANNFIYIDSKVKSNKVYGYGNYNPWYFINGGSYSSLLEQENCKKKLVHLETNQFLITKELKDINIPKMIENYIINHLDRNFDSKNYVLEINGEDIKYYDYVLYVDDVRTNYGYTVSIENEKIVKISDNMNGYSYSELETIINKKYNKKVNYNDIDKIVDIKVNKKYPDAIIEKKLMTNYYDENTGKIYRVIFYDIITNLEKIIYTEEYYEEI